MKGDAMTRVIMTQQMQDLLDDVLRLSSMVDKAVAHAIESLKDQNEVIARRVIADDEQINAARWEIEEKANLFCATQAPMAGDLRQIFAIVHISTELERMADYAKVIARMALQTRDEPLLKPLVDMPQMAEISREMLAAAMSAFVDRDAERAREIAARDNEIDHLYSRIYRELLAYMISDPETVPKATDLLWVAHNLERIGDRVTNICERIIYAATGQFEENIHSGSDR
jgi:phosphate transport system protein